MADNKAAEAEGLRLKNMDKTNQGARPAAGPAKGPAITELGGWRTEQETFAKAL